MSASFFKEVCKLFLSKKWNKVRLWIILCEIRFRNSHQKVQDCGAPEPCHYNAIHMIPSSNAYQCHMHFVTWLHCLADQHAHTDWAGFCSCPSRFQVTWHLLADQHAHAGRSWGVQVHVCVPFCSFTAGFNLFSVQIDIWMTLNVTPTISTTDQFLFFSLARDIALEVFSQNWRREQSFRQFFLFICFRNNLQ